VAPEELHDRQPLEPVREMMLNELVEEALRAHPAVESARNSVAAARFDYKRSKSTDLPTLDLSFRQSLGNDIDGTPGRTDEGSVVLNLNYNLYRGGADRANQRKKASAMHASKSFLDRVRRQAIDTLRLALAADRALQGQLPYLDRHSRKSLETVELYREEYLLQKRDLIDLLDAEGELNRALINQSEARYDAAAARFRVYEGLGALFGALNVEADVTDGDFRLLRLQAAGVDTSSLPEDRDGDGLPDEQDQCDNSRGGATVNHFGCAAQPQVGLGMESVDLTFEVVEDFYTTDPDRPVRIPILDILANDRHSPRDEPEIRAFTQAANGAVTSDGEGNLVYAPAAGFVGEDAFEYTIGDRRGRRASGVVRVQVSARAMEVERLHFEYKKLVLTPQSLGRLDSVAARLAGRDAVPVEVLAFTDNVGSHAYNRRLSERRAQAVRAMLVERGIDASRITARGMGEDEPIADNATDQGRALNRRVELRFPRRTGN
jgi:outer membrane protein OmpA-like peptidoglycan-associated protein